MAVLDPGGFWHRDWLRLQGGEHGVAVEGVSGPKGDRGRGWTVGVKVQGRDA